MYLLAWEGSACIMYSINPSVGHLVQATPAGTTARPFCLMGKPYPKLHPRASTYPVSWDRPPRDATAVSRRRLGTYSVNHHQNARLLSASTFHIAIQTYPLHCLLFLLDTRINCEVPFFRVHGNPPLDADPGLKALAGS